MVVQSKRVPYSVQNKRRLLIHTLYFKHLPGKTTDGSVGLPNLRVAWGGVGGGMGTMLIV